MHLTLRGACEHLKSVQWIRLCTPNARGPASHPSQGTRPHMLQLKILRATAKTQCSQTDGESKYAHTHTHMHRTGTRTHMHARACT